MVKEESNFFVNEVSRRMAEESEKMQGWELT